MKLWLLLFFAVANPVFGVKISEKTAQMTSFSGYFPLFWDEKTGKMYLEIPRWDSEFLYISSLPAGLGSNDIGLDRGQLGRTRVVRFTRSGPKVLLIQSNYAYRAVSDDPAERRAVRDSFAESTLAGFTVEAEEDGRVLVDATSFYLRDAHGVTESIQRARQGSFRLDPARSVFHLPMTRNFPQNTEVEVTLTFSGENPGGWVREVAPSPDALTVRQHHSFVQLPDNNYRPRPFDPRAGYFGISYFDFATPIDQPIRKQFISRHRLTAAKPIVYYLDRGAPEPIRSALLEGARWWSQAFEAAGFKDAFKVELMPENADPMDVRYNVIQWVHRSTRGWSYGASVTDPRTGEIIKGHVTLGSLRVRQDYMIAEGLLAGYESGKPLNPQMKEMALARLRQLSAHEVGHTLGLSHNYVASAANRASVMDYPHPWIDLPASGAPDLKNAYATGIGEWDKVAIQYGYAEAPIGRLKQMLRAAYERGIYFISDADSRPEGSAHPQSHLWDSGSNAADELQRLLKVRARALERFGDSTIPEGTPWSHLEEVLVPLYLLHRYQTEAASKMLGGLFYTYAAKGDGQKITEIVSAGEQRKALEALLATIDPTVLTLQDKLLRLIPPQAHGFYRTREDFRSRTGLTFDALAPAEAAANLTIGLILHPERADRLVQYAARDATLPSLSEVIDRLLGATFRRTPEKGLAEEVRRVIAHVTAHHLMALSVNESAHSQVRAVAMAKLEQLETWLSGQQPNDAGLRAHYRYEAGRIRQFLKDPKAVKLDAEKPLEPPPGQPIGMDCAMP